MNLNFRKINSKNVSVLSVVKLFHPDKGISIHQTKVDNLITLNIKNSSTLKGSFSILTYLANVSPAQPSYDQYWFLIYSLKTPSSS